MGGRDRVQDGIVRETTATLDKNAMGERGNAMGGNTSKVGTARDAIAYVGARTLWEGERK